jgi:hypothetical protein
VKAAAPLGAGLDPGIWADANRLSWLWHVVGRVTASSDEAWIERAAASIAEAVATYRAWPIPGVSGPAAEAAMLERVSRTELAALAARRAEIVAFFETLHAADATEDVHAIRENDPEALDWLAPSTGETSLAGNRFDSSEDAVEFVRALYAAGAVKVVIASEAIREEAANEWYADAIRVVLPAGRKPRTALFRMLNKEVVEEGFDLEEDQGQPVFYMWWD